MPSIWIIVRGTVEADPSAAVPPSDSDLHDEAHYTRWWPTESDLDVYLITLGLQADTAEFRLV